jgi:hypothetical protein
MLHDLRDHEQKIHSQCGEDGVLRRIYEVIGVTNRYYVEFGAWDGQYLSNTANLRINDGWSGLLMEGSDRADDELVQREFITAENVNSLFAKYDVPESFDLLSIDIDGNDYWVWRAIEGYRPRVVLMEYNLFFGLDEALTMPYDASHTWDGTTPCHGASIAALQKLGLEKGYTLVHAESWAPNAFFVLDSVLPAGFQARPMTEVTPWNNCSQTDEMKTRSWVAV